MKSSRRTTSIFKTIASSFLAAAVGCVVGYAYGKGTVPAHVLERSQLLLGTYATAGAAVGVIGLRMFAIARGMWRDYRD